MTGNQLSECSTKASMKNSVQEDRSSTKPSLLQSQTERNRKLFEREEKKVNTDMIEKDPHLNYYYFEKTGCYATSRKRRKKNKQRKRRDIVSSDEDVKASIKSTMNKLSKNNFLPDIYKSDSSQSETDVDGKKYKSVKPRELYLPPIENLRFTSCFPPSGKKY